MSDEQIAANQLQIDSSLEALNRIAQTTTFQGRKLLDGSLDFITTAGTNFNRIDDLQIDQANLGATGSVAVVGRRHRRRHAGPGRRRPTFRPRPPPSPASTTATFTNTVDAGHGAVR